MDGSLLRKSADAAAIWLVPGNGLAADRQAASEWYRKAAEQGLVQAQRLAFKGQEAWMPSALRMLEPRYSLGVMLERGEGIEVDRAESAKWYQKAAESGHVPSQNNLGAAYYLGEGVARRARDSKGMCSVHI